MGPRAQRIEQTVQAVRERSDRPFRQLLRAPPGGEGARFVQDLAGALGKSAGRCITHLELPEYDLDASEHVLGQLCQSLGVAEVPELVWDPHKTVHERVKAVTVALAPSAKDAPVFLLHVPRSWFRRPEDPRRNLPDNPMSVLGALLDPSLDAIVVAGSKPQWLERQVNRVAEDLPMPVADPGYLLDLPRWVGSSGLGRGDLHRRAWQLAEVGEAVLTRHSPLVLDLGVACLTLGCSEVEQAFRKADPYPDLVLSLKERMKTRREWGPALSRLTLPRLPVPEQVLLDIAGDLTDEQHALARCLLERRDGRLVAGETFREIVGVPRGPEPAAHQRLAQHYRTADGAPTPREAAGQRTLAARLEADHHRARTGPGGWTETTPLSRLITYERAWSWSHEFKEHAAAADIYRQLLADDPEDAYSHHYLAYNLDMAGKEGPLAWKEYERAVAIEPDNPWYNSRFITFLRDNGFRRDAHEAWSAAKERVPAGRFAGRLRLPEHFHRWIARSALHAGDLELARDVLATLTSQDFATYRGLAQLREELAQVQEIERLGEPVYPPDVPVAKRWGAPRLLPASIPVDDHPQGRPRHRWAQLMTFYPGRVEAIEDGTVKLVLADGAQGPLSNFEVDARKLERMAAGIPAQVGRFLEYGVYEGNQTCVRYHVRRSRPKGETSRLEESMRYLTDEAPARA